MNVLIISTNALGDTYLSLSLIKPFNKIFGNVKYSIISTSNSDIFLSMVNCEYICIRKKNNLFELIKLLCKIRKTKYNYAFSFFPGVYNTILLKLCSADIKGGYISYIKIKDWYDKKSRVYFKGINYEKYEWLPEMNYLDRISQVIRVIINNNVKLHKYKFEVEYLSCSKYIHGKYILLNPFSKNKSRNIPHYIIKDISQFLIFNKINFIILDFNCEYLLEKNTDYVINKIDFNDLLCLIKNCDLFISVDSFLIHIADAYNIKILGVFIKTNPESVLANLSGNKIIKKKTLRELPSNEIKDCIKEVEKNKSPLKN